MTVWALFWAFLGSGVAAIWLIVLFLGSMYSGTPFWELVVDTAWPGIAPALPFYLISIFLQLFYLWKKKGRPTDRLPDLVPTTFYPALLGTLFGITAVAWFLSIVDRYDVSAVKRHLEWPLFFGALSVLNFWAYAWLKKRKRQ